VSPVDRGRSCSYWLAFCGALVRYRIAYRLMYRVVVTLVSSSSAATIPVVTYLLIMLFGDVSLCAE